MNLVRAKFEPIKSALYGFTGDSVSSEGVLNLPIELGTHPCQHIQSVNFVVVDCPSSYNAIIGRPTLNSIRAVTSTYHLLVKFPTVGGIGVLKGDQQESCDIYEVANRPLNVHRVNIIEAPGSEVATRPPATIMIGNIEVKLNQVRKFDEIDPREPAMEQHGEPVEELEEIPLFEDDPTKTCKIGSSLTGQLRTDLINFLRDHPNVVLVKQVNGNWRVCVDFTDLNKACPKDSFPLPRIDQLMDATTGHELLSFMDAYSGYNQIRMHQPDQEHTAFLTDQGLYCYKVMPFGLKNAGATYQRLVNKMFKQQIGKTMEVYVDDMLVKSLKCQPFFRALRKGKDFSWTAECEQSFQELKTYLGRPPLLSKPQEGESFIHYLAVSKGAVSSALVREEEGV
ncbi:hypothetical protein UlMin_045789 [Ulmus minor]